MYIKVIAPRAKMNTRQNNFLCATRQCSLDIQDYIRYRTAAARAARNRCDTKRAMVIAAILDFDEGARPAVQAGERLASDRLKIKGIPGKLQYLRNQLILDLILDYTQDTRQP